MLDSLYEEALKKKGQINDKIIDLDSSSLDISSKWIKENFASSIDDFSIAAGDGSLSKKKYIGFYFYAVASESLIYNGELNSINKVEIDTTPYQKFIDDKLRNKMSLFEFETAIRTIKEYNPDYYMLDGSLLGDLIRPFPFDKDNRLSKDENIQKLIAIRKLLDYNKKIISISKTSSKNTIFEAKMPDIAIFDKYTSGEGFAKPFYKELNREMKHEFPIENEFFRSLKFTIFYLRLEDQKNIIKVELPYKCDIGHVRKIISVLKRDAVEGYPYLLKKAHNDVVIKNKNIDELAKIVGLYEKSGREMLR